VEKKKEKKRGRGKKRAGEEGKKNASGAERRKK